MSRAYPISILAAAIALAAPIAVAEPGAGPAIAASAGDWLIAPENGDPGCHVTLGKEEVIGGNALALAPECAKALPALADGAAAWRFAPDGLVIADATRKAMFTFQETEWGTYATAGEPGTRLLLTKAPPGVNSVPNSKNLFGPWKLTDAGGAALCGIDFKDGPPPGGEESFGLSLEGECADGIKSMKLASWRIEEMSVVLYGMDGESLVFLPSDDGSWATSPDGPGLYLLKR